MGKEGGRNRWALYVEVFFIVAAIASLLLQYGFRLGARFNRFFDGLDLALAIGVAGLLLFRIAKAEERRRFLRAKAYDLVLLTGVVGVFAWVWADTASAERVNTTVLHFPSLVHLQLGLVKLYLLGAIFLELLRGVERMLVREVRPELILAGSVGLLIFIGTALLLLPRAMASPEPLSLTDALFTSTSAACVTGLTVRDTGSEFSTLGQMIILGLIQVGGLGIIMFVAFLSVTSSRTLPVSQMVLFRHVINAPAMSDLKGKIVGVILFTALIEGAGAVALFSFFSGMQPEGDTIKTAFWSVFHSISAFCNAGFGLHSNSLEGYATAPGINFTIMGLIFLGGIGFLVIPELASVLLSRATGGLRRRIQRRKLWTGTKRRLSIQTRLTVVVTLCLILTGTAAFFFLERNHILAEVSWERAGMISLFQSVTPRTAGFNTVPVGELRDSTLLMMIILMVIGASPVSAGGGIKTVTFGILLLALRAMVQSRDRVELYGRTIPAKTLIAALGVFVLYGMTALAATLLLAVFEPGFQMRDHLFESISALSTVGLSTGITAQLSTPSKLVLCVAMFAGRIGPISLAVSVFKAKPRVEYDLPAEEVVVG